MRSLSPLVVLLLHLSAVLLLRVDANVRFVVTDLFLVSAESLDAAVAICESNPHAQAVGIDWGNANANRVLQLCVKRERLDDILSSSAPASSSSSSSSLVQKIAVYTTKSVCPPSEMELFTPQNGVLVCVRRVLRSAELLASGNFLSDVWVSTDKNYNSDVPGWTLLPMSVLEPADGWLRSAWQWLWTPTYSGAFITFQKPVMPIRELKVVAVARYQENDHENLCVDALGETWEHAGDATMGGEDHRAVLCLRRGDSSTSDRVAYALTNITVLQGSAAACATDHFNQKLPVFPADVALCLQWSDPATINGTTFTTVNHLRLAATIGHNTLRGQYRLASNVALSGRHGSSGRRVYLYAQSNWNALNNAIEDDDGPQPGLDSRPPLYARVHTSTADSDDNRTTHLSFKILQIADLHYSGDPSTSCNDVPDGMKSRDCSEALMTKFVDELLDLEKPDFVAFTGDNVQVYNKKLRQKAVDIVTHGVEQRRIPYAVIFGNHDDQKGFSRQQMMDMFLQKPHAYVRHGPKAVDGVGNYHVDIHSPVDGPWGNHGRGVFRMYFVDSHAYPDDSKYPHHVSKYDWIKPSQVAYYRQLSARHAANGNLVPAVMFFHIPLPEYAMDSKSLRTGGDHLEGVQSSGVNMNLFASLVERDEVKATFCGHDHVNDFCYKREGVQLCYGGGVGFGTAYGWSSVARRARVIEWSVDHTNRRTIRTWKRLFGKGIMNRQAEEVLYTEEEQKPMAKVAQVATESV